MEIKATANYCLDKRKIGLVYGGQTSGLGKTTALRAIAQELGPRRCTMVTIDKVDANPTGPPEEGLRRAARRSHGIEPPEVPADRREAERPVPPADHRPDPQPPRLEGRQALLPPGGPLRRDPDRAALGGTADIVAYLERQQTREADESLAQIRRRIFPCVDLMASLSDGDGGEPLVTVEQVREMFAKNKLKLTATAARYLCRLCNIGDSGAIGLCVQIVEYATDMAEHQRLPSIDVPLLQAAMRRGLTTARSTVILAQAMAAETPARIAKAG
jgi:hypothetical protein